MADQISAEAPGLTDWEQRYHYALGVFHGMWSTIDVTTDYAIGMFLKVPHEETHMITMGKMFGGKARLLSALIKRSEHPKRQALMTAFKAIRGAAKRDVVAHGYQISSNIRVGFVERPKGGDFKVKEYIYTQPEFVDHVDQLIANGNAFYEALNIPEGEIEAFVEAARSLDSKV